MKILGVSCFYHDSAAALIVDSKIVAAVQEERFTRIKHDPRFPHHAIQYCLTASGSDPSQVDWVVFYEKPFLKFERLMETYAAYAPVGFKSFSKSMSAWLGEKLFTKSVLERELKKHGFKSSIRSRILFTEHHQSHAGSAFFPSPFEESAILTMDGSGEWTTTGIYHGLGNKIQQIQELHFPHSLGLLYSAFTFYTGFKVNSGEYKMMGLAPYGNPVYVSKIYEHLIDVRDDGSFRLNMEYFDYASGLTMTNERFHRLFGAPPRSPNDDLTQREMDLACSIQAVCEDVVQKLAQQALSISGSGNLCLAGGVALNCVANGKILKRLSPKGFWIQPAAGDAGGAVGAALCAHYQFLGSPRRTDKTDSMQGGFLGPEFSDSDIHDRLTKLGAKFLKLDSAALMSRTVDALVDEKAVGWFQGRMEFGPRALGNRSILADPRSPRMQKILNLKVKNRESFRPFAPSVLREHLADWFELDTDSPYMLLVADVHKQHRIPMTLDQENLFGIEKLNVPRSKIPAVTHVDNSARVQTVHQDTNAKYYQLITEFFERTGCPCLVNTSFNVRGEPIVCTPEDAYRCFMGTEIDVLVIGDHWMEKSEQPEALRSNHFKEGSFLD